MTTDLQSAIQHWTNLAESKERLALGLSHMGGDESLIREAVAESLQASRTAEALRMEARTGKAHCSCSNPPHAVAR